MYKLYLLIKLREKYTISVCGSIPTSKNSIITHPIFHQLNQKSTTKGFGEFKLTCGLEISLLKENKA